MFDINQVVRPNIRALKPYSSARDEFSEHEGVFLDANENPYGNLNRYPDPYQKALKEKLADIKNIDNEKIFIGNGSDEVIDLSFRIFCEPGTDQALTFSPGYGMYQVAADINNVELLTIPLNTDFQIDKKLLENYLENPLLKLIIFSSPNNPSGNAFKQSDMEFILQNFNGIVLIDEAYIDFCPEKTVLPMLAKYPNLIVSQTFSKAWGLAAARVGSAYASKEIIALFNKVKAPYNVSLLNHQAALNALDNQEQFEQQRAIILSERERMIASLKKLKNIENIYPSDANFVLVKVKDANQMYAYLVQQKIITRNRNNLVNNCIRITVGTPKENTLLLDALKNKEI